MPIHRFATGLFFGACLLFIGCSSGPDQHLRLAKSTIENLIRGESKAEEMIDWEMFYVNDDYLGGQYTKLADEKQKSAFRRQCITSFSAGALKGGRGADATWAGLENWRVISHDSSRTVVAFELPNKNSVSLTISKRDGKSRLSVLAMGGNAKEQIQMAMAADKAMGKNDKAKRKIDEGKGNGDDDKEKGNQPPGGADELPVVGEPQYRSVHAKELEVFGNELRNQKIQMVGKFHELDDIWVRIHEFSDSIGIFFHDERGVLFQRAIADKKRFAKLLLEYKSGDRVRFIGHVQEHLSGSQTTYYFIVDAIRDYPTRVREEGERLEKEDNQARLAAQAALDRQKEQQKAAEAQRAKDAAAKAQLEKDRPKIEAMAAAGREKRNALLEKTNKLLRLKENREAAERTLPLIGQNGKTLMQAMQECEEILSKPETLGELPGFPSPERKRLADLKEQAEALRGKGIEVATMTIADLESQLTHAEKNKLANQARNSLYQDIERMKKYKSVLLEWDQKIADAQK